MTAASSALLWLPAAVASAAPAATSATARSAAPAHTSASTTKAVAPTSELQAGVIAGTVFGPAGVPLAGICVTATGTGGRALARTNGAGGYTLTGLRPGTYSIRYADCTSQDSYVAMGYPAGPVDVVSGQRTSLEPVALPAATPLQAIATERAYLRAHQPAAAAAKVTSAVTGTVRNRSGKPLAGICVRAMAKVSYGTKTEHFSFYLQSDAKTGNGGRYAIRGLPSDFHPVSWQLLFTVGCGNGGNYAPQWWRDESSARKATVLHAKPDGATLTGIDATLTEGGSIAGVIRGRSASGPGIRGACVVATGLNGQEGVTIRVLTGDGGRYVLHGLGSGDYDVAFSPCNAGNYLGASYGKITAVVGTTRAVSGFLPAGAAITGTVTSSQGGHAKLAKICVDVSKADSGILQFATTAATGRYTVDRLPHGTYYVGLEGCGNSGSYAPQFYRAGASTGSLSAASATGINLGVGGKATANVAMLPGGTVEGTVTTRSSGGPLRDACVAAIGQSGGDDLLFEPGGPVLVQSGNSVLTNSAGRYRLTNLRPDLYVLHVGDCDGTEYAGAWFAADGGISPQWLSVPAGTVAGVNEALPRAGTITGTVTNSSGHAVSGVCVEANQEGATVPAFLTLYDGVATLGTTTAKTGKYKIGGLPPGEYEVSFEPCINGKYAAQWYKDKSPGSTPTAVQVRAGHTTSGISGRLTSGKSVTGVTLSGITGKPIRACVEVGPGQSPEVLNFFGVSSKSGRFTLKHVVAGTYWVDALPCGAESSQLAVLLEVIKIPAGHSTKAIVLRLPRAGSIVGTVTGAGVPGGAAGACVDLVSGSGDPIYGADVARNGRYSMTDVAPGNYQLQVNDSCSGGTALAPVLAAVHVRSGPATSVNIALAKNGSITGTVTSSAASGPVAGICVSAYAGKSATQPAAVAITASNGGYQIGYLPPGSYVVKFNSGCPTTGYATQWYSDATSATTATSVVVSPGATSSGVDASLGS